MQLNIFVRIATFSAFAILASCGGGGGSSSLTTGSDVVTQGADFPEISWYSTAQPLIQRYCVACHTEGGPAPFLLETYEQVYGMRSALAFVLEADTMPPLGSVDLTPAESDILLQWLADGAPLGDVSQAPYKGIDAGFTYHGNARAIIETKCVTCHVDGGVAPFPLDSYAKVKSVAAAAAFSIDNGTMPPWPPTRGYSRFKHERALSAQDEFVLTNWLAGNLAEGNPQDYVPPVKEKGRDDLVYDLSMQLPEPYTPIERPDDHRCFAIDWPLDELAYVRSVNVIPDQLAEVHHVIVNIIEPPNVPAYLEANGKDGRPGWECGLSGGLPGQRIPRQIGGWVPGAASGAMPEGTGLGIEPGSLIVVQMHYNTLNVAEPTPDQTAIEIATSAMVDRPASGFLFTNPNWLNPGGMPIPAGDPDVRLQFEIGAWILAKLFGAPAQVTSSDKWSIHTGFLHMHTLAKTGRLTLIRPDGTEQVIIDIRDWDFDWQSTYALEREILVNPADSLRLECSWDNSAANQAKDGVQNVPKYVEWGENTGDEMCLTSFFMTRPKEGYDYSYAASVHIESPAYRQLFAPGDLVPLKLVFNNFSLHEPGEHGDADHADDHSAVYEGHYHVYLDSDDDTAGHVTAWDAKYFYQLPGDLAAGRHTLRVSLRGSDHHALGIEETVEIEVFDSPAAESQQLIDANDWVMQSAADDSFSAHRPAAVNCPDNSWYNEDGALEVQTGYCNYLALAQPAKVALAKGDSLHLVLWHGNLVFDALETEQAHAAITVDGHTVWEQNVKIPADANIHDVRVPIDFDAPVGSKVEYHLHNHGYNTWTLLQLEVER